MKEQLQLLLNLQTIDLDIDKQQSTIDQIRQQLQEHKEILDKLVQDLEHQRAEKEDALRLRAQKEEELREAEERTARSKERLMNVSSAKEYNALEKEIDQLRRKAEETREQLNHLHDAVEYNEKSISEKEEKISVLKGEIRSAEQEAKSQLSSLDGDLGLQIGVREKARESVTRPVLRRYDFIRKRRGGKAIVPVTNSACTGCYMKLPPQLYIELQRGSKLITCPSCQRILFYASEEASTATA